MTTSPETPGLRYLLAHPAHLLASGFGSGLSPVAPGTFGTLFAWLSFPLLRAPLSDAALLALLALLFAAGAFICARAGRALGAVDHGAIVWDEIVPFWLVLAFTPEGVFWQAAAFILFRFFDIAKPQPARWIDENLKHGLGVMLDDLVAALYTLLALALGRFLFF